MKHPDDMDVMELGEYLGYPECCIAAFIKRVMFNDLDILQEEVDDSWYGTGFVPCKKHRIAIKKGKIKVDVLIKNRACPDKFPNWH